MVVVSTKTVDISKTNTGECNGNLFHVTYAQCFPLVGDYETYAVYRYVVHGAQYLACDTWWIIRGT